MRMSGGSLLAPAISVALAGMMAAVRPVAAQNSPPTSAAINARQIEELSRGVVAINQGGGKVFVSWRLLGTDPGKIAWNLYRTTGAGAPLKLNGNPPLACVPTSLAIGVRR